MPFSVAVAGASGYAGGELLRLLAEHPDFEVQTVTAFQNAGQPLLALQPHLRSLAHLTLVDTTPENLRGHDVVFLALPHGKSGAITAQLGDDALVVDCGADHRLTDESAWAEYYGGEFFGAWAYGLPELLHGDRADRQRAELVGARRIAVPGCNVTAVTLALAPGIQAGVIESTDLVSVLAVGPSGAGKALKTHLLASELMGSASAYGVGGTHRHVPEIQQNLLVAGATEVTLSFTPVLVPMARGILATSTATLAPGRLGRRRPRRVGARLRQRALRPPPARGGVPANGRHDRGQHGLDRPRRRRDAPTASWSCRPSTTSSRAPPVPRSSRRTSPSVCPRPLVSR